MTLEQALERILTNPAFLLAWGVLVLGSLSVLVWDLRTNNPMLGSLMKYVWGFTVLYSGPIGIGVYWYSGRSQITHDSLWRRGFRSVSHCYSGCGAGEITGVVIAVGLLTLGNVPTALSTFALAYVAGYAMTVGPLLQEGVGFREAMADAFYSETASIAVMEVVAISTDLWLAGEATMGDTLFWSALVFSLSMGLIAAYPVNVLLIKWGVKEGMANPASMAS
ncbi:DUF4396 domain-containing protein [Halococcus salifodinae]|jgi:hypothetical protein|uniref:DUF4396 domain-containing protein n=1 Tax=Halococcus salifodinae DSM 8989 TaxID=1227456 RepID=M0NBR9_9EURY|nr:DUF4396 domain-containing protein [Halococcus salifodinae]EMA54524.1 hypothetical protein C450_05685 [Halococcus salifodinae DSM 8989]